MIAICSLQLLDKAGLEIRERVLQSQEIQNFVHNGVGIDHTKRIELRFSQAMRMG